MAHREGSVSDYIRDVDLIREKEYPMIQDAVYLDHAGTTLYSRSLMDQFAANMVSNLWGNPHSSSPSSQLSTNRIEDIRIRALEFFKADPSDFEIVFVANATAAIKLVMEAFRGISGGFVYGYHQDSHTSLIGVRECASLSQCLTDGEVDDWLARKRPLVGGDVSQGPALFAYPAQSNMDGTRLPLRWARQARTVSAAEGRPVYTLLDAAAFVSTSQLDLSDANMAPDFTVLSFNKIFGFPDLGALIIRKESGAPLRERQYFGGGTVETVVCLKEQWHAPKEQSLHEILEDGTLPIHNILALDSAISVHRDLYQTMDKISKHTMFLARTLYSGLKSLRHANDEPVCEMYAEDDQFYGIKASQGPIVTFNLRNSHGAWISNAEVEKLAALRNIHIRTGGLCNPGGVATALGLEPWELRRNFSAGVRCGGEDDIIAGKPVGVIRASLGAMSNLEDVRKFLAFIKEFYQESELPAPSPVEVDEKSETSGLFVQSLTIYPIKSCGGLTVPPDVDWEVKPEGLAWDREWCLLQQGTGQALNQKRYPRMALIQPTIDFNAGVLRVRYRGQREQGVPKEISVPLSGDPSFYEPADGLRSLSSRVCGEVIVARTYIAKHINDFFSRVLGVPCVLARFPPGGSGQSTRHAKAHMQKHQSPTPSTVKSRQSSATVVPDSLTPPDSDNEAVGQPILLSNESPILVINRASIDALNVEILKKGGKQASASVFRANIVIGSVANPLSATQAYSEDHWTSLKIGAQDFKMLGSCRRCHMICVDQDTAVKDEEPFVTLAKTRRFDGKVFFGCHMCHVSKDKTPTREKQYPTIRVGDAVTAS